jgi:hypothetical protein
MFFILDSLYLYFVLHEMILLTIFIYLLLMLFLNPSSITCYHFEFYYYYEDYYYDFIYWQPQITHSLHFPYLYKHKLKLYTFVNLSAYNLQRLNRLFSSIFLLWASLRLSKAILNSNLPLLDLSKAPCQSSKSAQYWSQFNHR